MAEETQRVGVDHERGTIPARVRDVAVEAPADAENGLSPGAFLDPVPIPRCGRVERPPAIPPALCQWASAVRRPSAALSGSGDCEPGRLPGSAHPPWNVLS